MFNQAGQRYPSASGMPPARYNAYSRFLKEKFGCRVYKISVDAGFSCPNRDGTLSTGGCVYCNNDSFRPRNAARVAPVPNQIIEGMDYYRSRHRAEKFIVYFQPYTNTHAPLKELVPVYESALGLPGVVGISIGTRPDCIDEEKLAWLEGVATQYFVTVEYGLQSIYNETLARIRRGHDFQCWADAMKRSRDRGIYLCAHVILGFPWESREMTLHTAEVISGRGLHFLKLHHLHVVRNTALADEYRTNPFPLLGVEEYTDLVVDFLERLDPSIHIERLFGTAPKDQLIGPLWGMSKAEIHRLIERKLLQRGTWQGKKAKG